MSSLSPLGMRNRFPFGQFPLESNLIGVAGNKMKIRGLSISGLQLAASAFILAQGPALLDSASAAERFSLGLTDAVEAASAGSSRVKAARQDWEAAKFKAHGQGGLLLPRLSLDGSYRYVSEVPAIEVSSSRPPITLGDNSNYSVGPSVSWVLWDFGALYNVWKAAEALAEVKEAEYRLAIRQAVLATSLLYFRIQLASEQVKLLAQALLVAQEQHKDIARGLRAGSASRLDKLLAHQEVLARSRQLAQARTVLGGALKDMEALTGIGAGNDTSFPMDADTARLTIADVPVATLTIVVDSLDELLPRLGPAAQGEFDPDFPGIAVHVQAAEAATRARRGVLAARLPRITVSGKSSLDYPNGPILEEFHQNMLAVSASVPIFEGGRLTRQGREQAAREEAAREKGTQAEIDARRDWRKAMDSLAGLEIQLKIGREAAKETAEAARLTYDAYKNGQVRLTEVHEANLRQLSAQVEVARIKAEMLSQLAVLKSLAKEKMEK